MKASPTACDGKAHAIPRPRHGSRQCPRGKTSEKTRRKAEWERGTWWASGGSCGGLIAFRHLVGVSSVPNGMGSLRGQSSRWEQGARWVSCGGSCRETRRLGSCRERCRGLGFAVGSLPWTLPRGSQWDATASTTALHPRAQRLTWYAPRQRHGRL